MLWTQYATRTLSRLEEFVFKSDIQTSRRHCCLSIAPQETKLVCVEKEKSGFKLITADAIHYDNINNIAMNIPALFSKHNLLGTPTTWLLNPEDYQCLLIDSLPTNVEELKSALQWRVRNVINFPISEAIFDYFTLPKGISSSQSTLVAAIVAQKKFLLSQINPLLNQGVNINHIEIPELALCSHLSVMEEDDKSHALFYLFNNKAIFNITHKKQLYFSRQIDLGLHTANDSNDIKQVCLEILRFFDYFQSHWRLPSPNNLYIGSNKTEKQNYMDTLSQQLMLNVTPLEIHQNILTSAEDPNHLNRYIPELACITYENTKNANTEN